MRSAILPMILTMGLAAPAMGLADIIGSGPDGVQTMITIQFHGCEVRNLTRQSKAGDFEDRYDSFDLKGQTSVYHEDSNHDLLQFKAASGDFSMQKIQGGAPGAQLDLVVKMGKASYKTSVSITQSGQTVTVQQSGLITDTGRKTVLGGVEFKIFAIDNKSVYPDATGTVLTSTRLYYNPDQNIAFEGETTGGTYYDAKATPTAPAAISLPGQPGFNTKTPSYDCKNP